MVAFDANVLAIAIYEDAGIPIDYRTGMPVKRARERVDALIDGLQADGDCILLPAPALGEAVTCVAEHIEQYIDQIEQSSSFKIQPFGKREAIEIAIRTKAAKLAGDKREGVDEPWQKVKYDRQIIASAKTAGASAIYSTDKHIHEHGKLWGIRVIHIADLPFAANTGTQAGIFEEDEIPGEESDNSTAGEPSEPKGNTETPINNVQLEAKSVAATQSSDSVLGKPESESSVADLNGDIKKDK